VVAVAGQTVSYENSRLRVDGQESRWQPTDTASVEEGTSLVIPSGHYYILPDDLLPVGVRVHAPGGPALGVVPAGRVRGIVFFRSWPFWRVAYLR
jgi:hypothetical protein